MTRLSIQVAAVGWAALLAAGLAVAQGAAPQDVRIAHRTTVPSSAGETVQLAARHYPAAGASAGAVVVVSSDPLPAAVGFGLGASGFDHLTALAGRGFDVFAADVTGYGHSPRPRMRDACNTPEPTQVELLIPHPLYIPCVGGYARLLSSLATDWDDIDAIVDHVRDVTGHDAVSLIGWGFGGARAAGYAARHPVKVDRLVLIAPAYDPDAPAEAPAPYPEGYPLVVHDVDHIIDAWRSMGRCSGFAEPDAVRDALAEALNASDPLAAGWGLVPGDLFRSPGTVGMAGWNRDAAASVEAPTLVVRGTADTLSVEAEALFDDLGADAKIRLDVECGTHWLLWEETGSAVVDAIGEFLATGVVSGRGTGLLSLDREGAIE